MENVNSLSFYSVHCFLCQIDSLTAPISFSVEIKLNRIKIHLSCSWIQSNFENDGADEILEIERRKILPPGHNSRGKLREIIRESLVDSRVNYPRGNESRALGGLIFFTLPPTLASETSC